MNYAAIRGSVATHTQQRTNLAQQRTQQRTNIAQQRTQQRTNIAQARTAAHTERTAAHTERTAAHTAQQLLNATAAHTTVCALQVVAQKSCDANWRV